jgi:menaquinol-cytochrome c reductase iron-sulfur subunit
MIRREFYRFGTMVLGTLMTAAMAVPGVAYLLDPLRTKRGDARTYKLAKLSDLEVNVPRSYQIVDERQDAWVKYPKEPIGLVWLIRQPDNTVIAFQAECPHLGCAVNLSSDKKTFRCPCHDSAFSFDGTPQNQVPPRPMDRLTVDLIAANDPVVMVTFERFRAQSEEKIPLV